MAIPYEKLVAEDLQRGYGTVPVTMPAGGSMPGTMVGLHTFFDTVHIKDFGGVPDGVTDTTPAFNAALAAVANGTGRSVAIRFGPGVYTFKSQPNAIGTGISLQGNAPFSSTPGYGTWLECAYSIASATQGFLVWDGSYAPGFAGAGGGLRDLCVNHSGGNGNAVTSGGCAVLFTGANETHKADVMFLSNVGIGNNGSCGTWNKGLKVDGTNCATGIRSIFIEHVNISMCSDADSNIYLINAFHVHAVGIHCYPGTGLCGITVTGTGVAVASTNVFFASTNIDGNLTIDSVLDLTWHGRIGANLSCTANSNAVCIIGGVHGTIDIAHTVSVQIFTDAFTYLQQMVPIFDQTFPTLSGIFSRPRVAGQGADHVRAAANPPGTASVPLGLSNTPSSGGAGCPYLGSNQNQNPADNNAQYFSTGFPAFRMGNPLGNGTFPWWLYVAPSGTAGNAISYLAAAKANGTTGVVEFPAGIAAGDTGSLAFRFQLLTVVTALGSGSLIANGATSVDVNFTVAGAALGDPVIVSHTGVVDGSWVLYGTVASAGNVKARLLNVSGGSLNTPAGTMRVVVQHLLA